MIMRLRRNQKGFTLLEVMLVVIIIGIIAIIALPRLLVTRERARDEACDSNVQAIRTQLEQYYWAYGDFPSGITDFMTQEPEFWPSDSSASDTCPSGVKYDDMTAGYNSSNGSLICDYHAGEPGTFLSL
jgi:prepilin-type N-terminal cleavage/methylation domain-containing protein